MHSGTTKTLIFKINIFLIFHIFSKKSRSAKKCENLENPLARAHEWRVIHAVSVEDCPRDALTPCRNTKHAIHFYRIFSHLFIKKKLQKSRFSMCFHVLHIDQVHIDIQNSFLIFMKFPCSQRCSDIISKMICRRIFDICNTFL